MPIKIMYEKEPEQIAYPAMFCDLCGQRIIPAYKGGCYYVDEMLNVEAGEDRFNKRTDILYLHHKCKDYIQRSERVKGEPFWIKTPYGTLSSRKVSGASWFMIKDFIEYLEINMNGEKVEV